MSALRAASLACAVVCCSNLVACGSEPAAAPDQKAEANPPATPAAATKPVTPAPAETAAAPVDQQALKKRFAEAAKTEITAENADAVADALEKELEQELAE